MQQTSAQKRSTPWWKRFFYTFYSFPKDGKQLLKILEQAQAHNLINHEIFNILKGVLEVVNTMQVRDIMIPAAQITTITDDESPENFLPSMIESGHSRFPVVNAEGKVIGLLFAKDLLQYLNSTPRAPFDLKQRLRPAFFVPESKRLNSLLKEFRLKQTHMAVVVNEYGDMEGAVTIEDILERIVGDIKDEYDSSAPITDHIQPLSDNYFWVNALIPIAQFIDYFKHPLPNSKQFDTLGGLIAQQFGYHPKRGETLTLPPFQFEISDTDQRRIRFIKVAVDPSTNS